MYIKGYSLRNPNIKVNLIYMLTTKPGVIITLFCFYTEQNCRSNPFVCERWEG